MATVTKRMRKVGDDGQGEAVYREDGWIVRFVDADGAERKKSFARKGPAALFAAEVEQAKARGTYVDPRAGKVTFREYAEAWRLSQPHRVNTAAQVESRLRVHLYPTIGHRPIAAIRRTELQALVSERAENMSRASLVIVTGYLASVFKAAVADRVIAQSPATGLRLPSMEDAAPVVPFSRAEVDGLYDALPERWRLAVQLGVGAGLRIGEVLGLTVDRVDFLRRELLIDRQMLTVKTHGAVFGPPKTRASRRTIPIPSELVDAIAAQVAEFPHPDGLLFTYKGAAPTKRHWSVQWVAAVAANGLAKRTRFHRMRHTYASLLIDAGCSVKVVQARLGHATAQETLDTYAHLWPADEDRTRAAVAGIFRPVSAHDRPIEGGVTP